MRVFFNPPPPNDGFAMIGYLSNESALTKSESNDSGYGMSSCLNISDIFDLSEALFETSGLFPSTLYAKSSIYSNPDPRTIPSKSILNESIMRQRSPCVGSSEKIRASLTTLSISRSPKASMAYTSWPALRAEWAM